jgi:L-amino acid N-acyltransferase YncA
MPQPRRWARHLDIVAGSGNSVVIVAEAGGDLAGYVELAGGLFRRNRATASVVIGVVAAASGKGHGAGLLRRARDWAARHGLHRLELTVMAHNHRAADLYQRMGFFIEGRRAECLLVDGRFIDELYMAALIITHKTGARGETRRAVGVGWMAGGPPRDSVSARSEPPIPEQYDQITWAMTLAGDLGFRR